MRQLYLADSAPVTMSMSFSRVFGSVALLLFVSACQTVPSGTPPPWSERVQLLSEPVHYSARGRISVRHLAGAEQGDFALSVDAQEFDLRVQGPFGIGAITLAGTPSQATLTSARTGVVELQDLDAELVSMLGYPLPMDALRYWLLGLPQPLLSAQKTYSDDGSVLNGLAQAGWRVEFPDYRQIHGLPLPRKIRLFGPDVEIRLAIRRWELPELESL